VYVLINSENNLNCSIQLSLVAGKGHQLSSERNFMQCFQKGQKGWSKGLRLDSQERISERLR
jgi:hypothetical protein